MRVMMAPGWPVAVSPAGYEDLRYWLRYEGPTAALLRRIWRGGMNVLDVGAHHGLFSLCCCRPGALPQRIVTVEPSLAAQPQLEANRRVQRDVPWTNVLAAAGEREGRLTLHPGLIHMLVVDPALHAGIGNGGDAGAAVEVRETTIDQLCREQALSPDLIKIDVEGYEAEALRGARATLERSHPLIVLEWHRAMLGQRGLNARAALEPLVAAGYRFEPYEHPELGLLPAEELDGLTGEDIYRFCCHPQVSLN